MSLLLPPIVMELTDEELELVTHPTNGSGGADGLLCNVILPNLIGRVLTLEDTDLQRTRGYAYNYGDGTYQRIFRAVLAAAYRAGWVPPDADWTPAHSSAGGRSWSSAKE